MTPAKLNPVQALLRSMEEVRSTAEQQIAKARRLHVESSFTSAVSRELVKETKAVTERGRNRRFEGDTKKPA